MTVKGEKSRKEGGEKYISTVFYGTCVCTYVPLTGLWSTMSDAEITSLYLYCKQSERKKE
jgi:hypothetical protein